MNDYMTALLERFGITTQGTAEAEERVRAAEETLKEQLTAEQRKLLLRLTDHHNALRDEAALTGFVSGYRLAEGIHRELETLPRFLIMAEAEERARKQFERERGEHDGETQAVR